MLGCQMDWSANPGTLEPAISRRQDQKFLSKNHGAADGTMQPLHYQSVSSSSTQLQSVTKGAPSSWCIVSNVGCLMGAVCAMLGCFGVAAMARVVQL